MRNQFRSGIGSLCACCLSVLTLISASSPQAAIHLLPHKIQSPQEKEALQALTVCNGDPHLLIFKFVCFDWVNWCWFEEITAHYLLTSHICYDYTQPPPHDSLYCLFMHTFTGNMFLLVMSAPKGTNGFLRCSLSVIHLNWSHGSFW